MRRCFALARAAQAKGNHPFGALLLVEGQIVMEAENSVTTDKDVTCHAELNLISRANRELGAELVQTSTLYTSTEPCAMCTGAAYWSGITEIVYGCPAEVLGDITGGDFVVDCADLLSKGKRHSRVLGPILEAEAKKIHQDYWPHK